MPDFNREQPFPALLRHRTGRIGIIISHVQIRTLYRDIASLQAQGAAIAGEPGENAVLVAAQAGTAEEVAACWNKLSEGAAITSPLAPSQWSPLCGMLKDRFGVHWVLSVAVAYTEA